jgi:hypothetical protein
MMSLQSPKAAQRRRTFEPTAKPLKKALIPAPDRFFLSSDYKVLYLEYGNNGLGKGIEIAALCHLPAKDLHADEGKHEDVEEQQGKEGEDGANGVDEGSYQVPERPPVPSITPSISHRLFVHQTNVIAHYTS